MPAPTTSLEEALAVLSRHAAAADGRADWPGVSWEAIRRAGVLGWCVPREFGGQALGPV
jgi:alkylation response protein AidB-like acyl-CoA dehydrogenase